MKNWSDDLRRKCVILVSDSRPAALYYGERKVLIYNEGKALALQSHDLYLTLRRLLIHYW